VAKALATLGGEELRYVRTYFVAEDEICFHVFEAASREVVVEAAERAGLTDARITEAVERAATSLPGCCSTRVGPPRLDVNDEMGGAACLDG
jgi:hypothetical protein